MRTLRLHSPLPRLPVFSRKMWKVEISEKYTLQDMDRIREIWFTESWRLHRGHWSCQCFQEKSGHACAQKLKKCMWIQIIHLARSERCTLTI